MPKFGSGSKYPLDYKDIRSYVGITHKIENDEDRLIYIWSRLTQYGHRRSWNEDNFIDGMSCCLDQTMYKVYMAHCEEPLQNILNALAERFIDENTLQETIKRVRNFTRKSGESIQSAMSRLHDEIDKIMIIYPPKDRDARKGAMLEESVRSLCSPEAKIKIDEAIIARRAEGGYMQLRDYLKIASLYESRSDYSANETTTSLQVYSAEMKEVGGYNSTNTRPATPHPSSMKKPQNEIRFDPKQRSNSKGGSSRPPSRPASQQRQRPESNSRAGGRQQSNAGQKGSNSRSPSQERSAGYNQDNRSRPRSKNPPLVRAKPMKIGTDEKGVCDACNSEVPHTAQECYALKKYIQRSPSEN